MFPLLKLKVLTTTRVNLTLQFQADLCWWLQFLHGWNGVSLVPSGRDVHVFCDSSSFGLGAWWDPHWFSGVWDPKWRVRHINEKELTVVRIAIRKWGHLWAGNRVHFHVDNMVAVHVCTSGRSRNKHLAKIMREIFWDLSKASCKTTVSHIKGVENVRADALSRALVDDSSE
jgi:hypothetical protein